MNIIKPNLKFRGTLQKRALTKYIVLHHADASKATVQDIHRWHLQKGWAGIGYHFYVRKNGEVYEGRPIATIGAHCLGHNSWSVGICAEGKYNSEIMPPKQKQALIELINYVKKLYPAAKVVGHRNLMATDCPGENYPLSEFKSQFNK
ncbi:N-acetylmuramoyl-L-alanine amidase family 2 [Caldicellulosiruptor owensensis OL]|uniref:N-acetylmuramoyl-L-alanine amidase family 2 n=1 Tax=Caldicellulosiruptor owensensis (strain ATCC 700167 / DSM 13100 / OL) TaxID=632518 RepID=E4Q638_CALOW|nr:N-acetylmuramoyl-L-alanine amidase [Caldicellulosiruptor owensensis]ADQ04412.1 N-acetylmuramoyl-L-alanine amidase family 2 [Caldicellulosiruptor owensensis OL]